MHNKHFWQWHKVKVKLHFVGRVPHVNEGEIWWYGCGENVGIEINGKHEVFSRPVLIFKKLSRFSFMGIPLTSRIREGSWYSNFTFRDKRECAVLCQARVYSVARLYDKMGRVSESDLELVRQAFANLYCKKNIPLPIEKGSASNLEYRNII